MIVDALAPAKLNLGLEILGRRDDGFHEIRTILAAIGRFDRLRVRPAPMPTFWTDRPELGGDENLVAQAAVRLHELADAPPVAVELRKRIPAAAGLGGASADAAATLLAIRAALALPVDDAALAGLAGKLGCDVPFFLRGGVALAEGRGDLLTPLPPMSGMLAVVVTPRIAIPSKTATLFRALRPSDFTDGSRVGASALADRDLSNAFSRPLYALVPSLADLPPTMEAAGADRVALSGAGPSHYALETNAGRARAIARQLVTTLRGRADVCICRFIPGGVLLSRGDEAEPGWERASPGTPIP